MHSSPFKQDRKNRIMSETRPCFSHRLLLLLLTCALCVGIAPRAMAQDAAPDQVLASSVAEPNAKIDGLQPPMALPQEVGNKGTPVRVFNRALTTFRATYLGSAPADRVRRAQWVMTEMLTRLEAGVVTVQKEGQNRALMVDGEMVFILTPEDVDLARHQTLDAAANAAKRQIEQLIQDTQESRDGTRFWHSALAALAAASRV